jgi:hypothetical protein
MTGTNRPVPDSVLSRLVADRYRAHFKRLRRKKEFERLLATISEDLQEAARHGGDPAFLLHVLVCTKFVRQIPQVGSEVLRKLKPKQRATLIGGLRALRALGPAWLEEVFGRAEGDQAQALYRGIAILCQKLTLGVALETPAFQRGMPHKPLTARKEGDLLTACILCILEELKQHPKPVEATVVLLRRFELLEASRGDSTAIAFVRKRAQRSKGKASDPFSPVGSWVKLLRLSYDGLIDHLKRERKLLPGRQRGKNLRDHGV